MMPLESTNSRALSCMRLETCSATTCGQYSVKISRPKFDEVESEANAGAQLLQSASSALMAATWSGAKNHEAIG